MLLDSLNYFVNNGTCAVYGFVVMPNHFHIVMRIKKERKIYFQKNFLMFTSQRILRDMKAKNSPLLERIKSTQADRKYHFWKRNANWIRIPVRDVVHQKLHYIHKNPLQDHWKLSKTQESYPMSSALSYKLGKSQFEFLELYDE